MASLDELFERFPEMKPVKTAPAMSTLNGVGARVYGRRDYDPESGTYVLTHWFTILYIPILPLGAYRVANAENGGWYFLGRVPVSAAAKAWATCLLLIAASVGGAFAWKAHTGTPAYQAGQRLAEANRLRDVGSYAAAAKIYREVAEGKSVHAAAAVQAVNGLLDNVAFQEKAPPAELSAVFGVAHDLLRQPGALGPSDLFDRGVKLAEARTANDPAGALALLEAIEPMAPAPDAAAPAKQKLLERITADHPDDMEALAKLAVVYESTGQLARCQALLEPHQQELGVTEGRACWG